MGKTIVDRIISRVHIIDDNEIFRGALEEAVQESELQPIQQQSKVESVDRFLMEVVGSEDAVVSDHQLKIKNYFPINGAEVVYKCYEHKIPSVLVTRYETHIDEIRRYRKNIPVILNPEDFEPDTLIHSLEVCINEFNGNIRQARKGWRTLVRIDGADESHVYVIIPAWHTSEVISINKSDLPEDMRGIAVPEKRFHACINIGTESPNDLYFTNWESK
jgi:hypothetical protein